eukprot:m.117411 g.117411  ORF g.117411 m.117411 type:complete len:149 (-) comp9516_c0_seq10:64-510(-)
MRMQMLFCCDTCMCCGCAAHHSPSVSALQIYEEKHTAERREYEIKLEEYKKILEAEGKVLCTSRKRKRRNDSSSDGEGDSSDEDDEDGGSSKKKKRRNKKNKGHKEKTKDKDAEKPKTIRSNKRVNEYCEPCNQRFNLEWKYVGWGGV